MIFDNENLLLIKPMTTIEKVSEKLTIHVNRTGFYALISVFIAPLLVYPLLKFDKLKEKQSKLNCAQLDSQLFDCDTKENGLKENKKNFKQAKWNEVIKKAIDNTSEIDKALDLNYQVAADSRNQDFEFRYLKRLQPEIEAIVRYTIVLFTDSKQSITQTTQIESSLETVNFSKAKIIIFYSFIIFIICSILESKPFYERLIFDRQSKDLTILKTMIFWFKKNKYSFGDNFNLFVESETDDYDTTTHKLNLILESGEKIILYQDYNYDEIEKLLKEIREFLNFDSVKFAKL